MVVLKLCFVALAAVVAVISAQSAPARPGQAPYIVSLRTGGRHFCSATIVNRRWFITAGRCLRGRRPDQIVAFAGTTTTRAGRPFAVDRVHIHPNINDRSANNDIGMLRTVEAMQWDRYMASVRMAYLRPQTDQTLLVAGWGYSENPAGNRLPAARGHNQLQIKSVGSIKIETCRAIHRTLHPLLQTHTICTMERPQHRGSCGGDTGSPLMLGAKFVGVQLWRTDCTGRSPTVFVNPQAHFNWFVQAARQG